METEGKQFCENCKKWIDNKYKFCPTCNKFMKKVQLGLLSFVIGAILICLGFLIDPLSPLYGVIMISGFLFAGIPLLIIFVIGMFGSVVSANLEEEVKQKRIANDKAQGKMISCPMCHKKVSSKAKSCPECGNPIDTKIYCPKCGSSNTKPISNTDKIVSVGVVGVFAANKVVSKNKCLDCKHNF